jgi:hypothetical protein
MNQNQIDLLIKYVEDLEKGNEAKREAQIEYNWIGLNEGPVVVRLYAKELPEFSLEPESPKFIFFSRVKNKDGRLVRVYWPKVKGKGMRPEVDKSFILYKALQTIRQTDPSHPILANNKNEGSKFNINPFPKMRVVFNSYDRVKQKVGILCEKTFTTPSGDVISMDLGISEALYDRLIAEVLKFNRTLDIDIYIHRVVKGTKVEYLIRDFSETKKPDLLIKYGSEEPPSFEGLYNLDEFFAPITENQVYELFPHIIEAAESIGPSKEGSSDLKSKYSDLSEEELKLLKEHLSKK